MCNMRNGSFQYHSFVCRHTVVPTLFSEKTYSFPIELSWHPCQKSIVHKCEHLYFWTPNSVSLIFMSVLMPVPHCFDYCSFIVILKSEHMSHWTFSFETAWAVQGLLHFHMNFSISLSIYGGKKTARILIEIALSL